MATVYKPRLGIGFSMLAFDLVLLVWDIHRHFWYATAVVSAVTVGSLALLWYQFRVRRRMRAIAVWQTLVRPKTTFNQGEQHGAARGDISQR